MLLLTPYAIVMMFSGINSDNICRHTLCNISIYLYNVYFHRSISFKTILLKTTDNICFNNFSFLLLSYNVIDVIYLSTFNCHRLFSGTRYGMLLKFKKALIHYHSYIVCNTLISIHVLTCCRHHLQAAFKKCQANCGVILFVLECLAF